MLETLKELIAKIADARELQDLQAQIDMAFWARWMFWATVVGMLISVGAVIAGYLSLKASRKALDLSRVAATDAREIGEYQTQAYVHATNASFGKHGNIIVTCKNGGLTPATHFSVNCTAQLVNPGSVTASISFENSDFKIWSALGVGEELTVSVLDGNSEIMSFINQQGSKLLLVSGQIVYCTVFNHDHVTQFAFFVTPGSNRFRRPTANLTTFHRLEGKMTEPRTVQVKLEENDRVES